MWLKKLKNNDGFTLIELIVAINISCLVITILVAFYLFVLKFTFTLERKIEDHQQAGTLTYLLNDALRKADVFSIEYVGEQKRIVLNNKDIIIFSVNEIGFKDRFQIEGVKGYKLRVKGNQKLILENDQVISEEVDLFGGGVITSNDVESLFLEFNYKNKTYKVEFYSPLSGMQGFKNAGKNDI